MEDFAHSLGSNVLESNNRLVLPTVWYSGEISGLRKVVITINEDYWHIIDLLLLKLSVILLDGFLDGWIAICMLPKSTARQRSCMLGRRLEHKNYVTSVGLF